LNQEMGKAQEGMIARKLIDLTGQRFGKWLVLRRAANNKTDHPRWRCRCDCGREVIVIGASLRNGKSKGCHSCQAKGKNVKHGRTGFRLYHVWQTMIQRCENPNNQEYKNYGGRGISICFEWHDAATFFKWAMANGYGEDLTIDRINNDGNYEPNNCRFIIEAAQHRNTRRNRLVRIGNETKLLIEWAEISGISSDVLSYRIGAGWPESKLLKPVEGAGNV